MNRNIQALVKYVTVKALVKYVISKKSFKVSIPWMKQSNLIHAWLFRQLHDCQEDSSQSDHHLTLFTNAAWNEGRKQMDKGSTAMQETGHKMQKKASAQTVKGQHQAW